MEYCNLGPLHHFVAERRFFKPPDHRAAAGEEPQTGGDRRTPGSNDVVDMPLVLTTLLEVASALLYLHRSGRDEGNHAPPLTPVKPPYH